MDCKRKRVADRLDYDVDFRRWVLDCDSLQSAEAIVMARSGDTGEEPSLAVDAVQVFVPHIVKVWLSGGSVGATYEVVVTATTEDGRVKETTFMVRVSEC